MDTQAILLSADEAAELLRMTPRQLTRLANRGAVPVVDLGDGVLRFDRGDLQAWTATHKRPAEGVSHAK